MQSLACGIGGSMHIAVAGPVVLEGDFVTISGFTFAK